MAYFVWELGNEFWLPFAILPSAMIISTNIIGVFVPSVVVYSIPIVAIVVIVVDILVSLGTTQSLVSRYCANGAELARIVWLIVVLIACILSRSLTIAAVILALVLFDVASVTLIVSLHIKAVVLKISGGVQ